MITVGDTVHWTHVTGRGSCMSLRKRDGVVVAVNEETGTAKVRVMSGRVVEVRTTRLRLPEQPSQIMELIAAAKGGDTE